MGDHILQDWAAARAEELPGVSVDQPFGPEVDVFRVRERMFMALSRSGSRTSVTLKSDPSDAEALRETFPAIVPGYHMNKRHWITLQPDGSLPQDLVEELVQAGRVGPGRPASPYRPIAVALHFRHDNVLHRVGGGDARAADHDLVPRGKSDEPLVAHLALLCGHSTISLRSVRYDGQVWGGPKSPRKLRHGGRGTP